MLLIGLIGSLENLESRYHVITTVMSGRFSKTQMMRASALNYAALNKHA